MTDEKITEVMAHAIDPDVMESTTNGAFADVNEDVGRRQRETRERADEVLRSLRSAGYEIVPAGAVAEARAETHMYAEWRDQWQAKAEALAEAAQLVLSQGDDGGYTESAAIGLQEAINAFQQGGSGWRPIESAPRDGSNIVGFRGEQAQTTWLQPYYEKMPHVEGGPEYSHRWAYVAHDMIMNWHPTHWMPLPKPPAPKPEDRDDG